MVNRKEKKIFNIIFSIDISKVQQEIRNVQQVRI